MKVMRSKHLDKRLLSAAIFDSYPCRPPDLVTVDVTEDLLMDIVGCLSRGAGTGGTDSLSLQHWLLWSGAASGKLRLTVADFTYCLANGRPP